MDEATQKQRLERLRAYCATQGLSGVLVPVTDEYQGEYLADYARRLAWLTGFSGSAGIAVILKDKAALFTDGRYTLQAKKETSDALYEHCNSGDTPPEQWLAGAVGEGDVIGYDPMLFTLRQIQQYESVLIAQSVALKPLEKNPIDAVWENQPALPCVKVEIYPDDLAGEAAADKRVRLAKKLADRCIDAAIITLPDSIMWLLNIRGNDVPMTPFAHCSAVLQADGNMRLYIDTRKIGDEVKTHLGNEVSLHEPHALKADIETLGSAKKRILYDPAMSAVWFYHQLKQHGAEVVLAPDPCQLPKACKNPTEVQHIRNAHIRDGLAVTRFLCWFDGQVQSAAYRALNELDVVAKLAQLREAGEGYRGPSFHTIAGSGPNGAIVHYRPTDEECRKLDTNTFLLLDSGGQYLGGTTDITRTIVIGQVTQEMKTRFTQVLKGHIALAGAVFPEGTTGVQLDALARQYLWQAGVDYDHGTGHGVGCYLSVHEGPQRIGKRGGDAKLEIGMVLSNEPGYYKPGEYGIRIENLVTVVERAEHASGKNFLGFDTLTLVPIDLRAVDSSLLTVQEEAWLKRYHQSVWEAHEPHLDETERQWLRDFIRI